jgi:hypothetical protein
MITKIVSCHTSDSKSVKQEVNSTAILPPLVFHDKANLKNLIGTNTILSYVQLNLILMIVMAPNSVQFFRTTCDLMLD